MTAREPVPNTAPIPKGVRYQVLRRDNFACRYCGAAAPDVRLVLDHVVPRALGGSNDPSNLVTGCVDCNAGKAATPPGEDLVADVAQREFAWASEGRQRWVEQQRRLAERAERRELVADEFFAMWVEDHAAGPPIHRVEQVEGAPHGGGVAWIDYQIPYLPVGWEDSLIELVEAGVSLGHLRWLARAGRRHPLYTGSLWSYVAAWGRVQAQVIAEGRPTDSVEAAL